MIKITKTDWRALIELHLMKATENGQEDSGDILYFDVTKRPLMIATQEGYTVLVFDDTTSLVVKESMKDILKTVDKLIAQEAAAREQRIKEATEASVKAYEELSNNNK